MQKLCNDHHLLLTVQKGIKQQSVMQDNSLHLLHSRDNFNARNVMQQGCSRRVAVQGKADACTVVQSSSSTEAAQTPSPTAAESGMWTGPRPLLYRCHAILHACTQTLII